MKTFAKTFSSHGNWQKFPHKWEKNFKLKNFLKKVRKFREKQRKKLAEKMENKMGKKKIANKI